MTVDITRTYTAYTHSLLSPNCILYYLVPVTIRTTHLNNDSLMFCRHVFEHAWIPRARNISTKPMFPFPTGTPNPTPHQIFHLPRNAPQADIKKRCNTTRFIVSYSLIPDSDFDLVRIYHPDKVDGSIPSSVAHARFQAITTAYNALRGTSPPSVQDNPPTPTARSMYKRNRNLYSGPQLSDDSWKDRIIVAAVIFVRLSPARPYNLLTKQAAFCFAMQTAATRRTFIAETMERSVNATTTSSAAPIEDARLAEPDPN